MPRTKKAKETAENKAPEIDYSPVFDIQVPRPETFNFGPATNPIPVTTVPVLTASQWVMMAREIADSVIRRDAKDLSDYSPELLVVARRYAVIKYFSNFELPDGGANAFWLLVNYTALYDDIIDRIRFNDVKAIFDAADKLISARLQKICSKGDLYDAATVISGAVNKLGEKFSSVDFNGFIQAMSKLPEGEKLSVNSLVDAILATNRDGDAAESKE